MGTTGTDLFSASFSKIAGIVRAGNARLTFTADSTTVELAALDVKFVYSQEVKFDQIMDGKTLVIVSPATGVCAIGALLGTDTKDFIETYGSLCDMNGNEIRIEMAGEMTCSDPSLQSEINAYESATITMHSCLITNVGTESKVRGILVRNNIQLRFLNAEWTAA